MIRFGSVCSGIEAASVAWHPLGWRASFLSEIEAFPRAVLSHHYPETPLHGDFTTIQAGQYDPIDPIDLLVGGTPCQDFSIAGLRAGMAGDRGNLTLQFLTLARRLRPKWVVWENVPGVLSSNGGRDFGSFLGGLGELGYGWSYRTLDAQYFGVPQRRRRVFVVGYFGDWRRSAAVLFERHSLQGHPAPRREAGTGVAPTIARGSPSGGRTYGLCADTAEGLVPVGIDDGSQVGHALTASHTASHTATGRLDPSMQTFAIQERAVCENVNAGPQGAGYQEGVAYTLEARTQTQYVATAAVRRLTPRECERLQGFPDDYTLIPYGKKLAGEAKEELARYFERTGQYMREFGPQKWSFDRERFEQDWPKISADGPRYKALGNSMAVPVMRWIGERIQMVEALA